MSDNVKEPEGTPEDKPIDKTRMQEFAEAAYDIAWTVLDIGVMGVMACGKGFLRGKLVGCAANTVQAFIRGSPKGIAKAGIEKIGEYLAPVKVGTKTLFKEAGAIKATIIDSPILKPVIRNPEPYVATGGFTAAAAGLAGVAWLSKNRAKKREEEDVEVERIKRKHQEEIAEATTDFALDEKQQIKPIIPLTGVVVPRVKIAYHTKNSKGEDVLVDLMFYWRVVSVTWVDTNDPFVPTVTFTCLYTPDLMKFARGTVIYPLIGTHEGSMLNLGAFYLAQIGKSFSHGSYLAHLSFTSVNYDKPYSNTPLPKEEDKKSKTYFDKVKKYADLWKFGYDVKDAREKLNQPIKLNLDNGTASVLEVLSMIAKELELTFSIRNQKFIFTDKASDKSRKAYTMNIGMSSDFNIKYDLTNSFTTAQVVSSVPRPGQKEKPIIGKATASKSFGPDGEEEKDSGKIMTKFIEVKTQQEADRLAAALLNRVNTSVVDCNITIPNCLIFAGHNIILHQNLPNMPSLELPLFMRIEKAAHEISASGWTAKLDLSAVKVENRTPLYQKTTANIEKSKEMGKLVDELKKITLDKNKVYKAIDKYDSTSDDNTPLSNKKVRFNRLAKLFDMNKYPNDNPEGNELNAAMEKFMTEAKKIDAELKLVGSSLALAGVPMSKYIDEAFEFAEQVAQSWVAKE